MTDFRILIPEYRIDIVVYESAKIFYQNLIFRGFSDRSLGDFRKSQIRLISGLKLQYLQKTKKYDISALIIFKYIT